MLARRAYSVGEMRRALARKFPHTAGLPEVVARLRQLNFLDDRKFAAQYAHSLAENRGFGRYRVRRELKAKLVDYGVIEPALASAFEATDERALLERALDRKIRTLRLPVTRARLASLCQGLLRRGFAASDIMKAVRSRPKLTPLADDVDISALEEADESQSSKL